MHSKCRATVDRRLGTARAAEPHGATLMAMGAIGMVPFGVLLILGATATRRRWRYHWLVQALPLLYVASCGELVAMTLR